MFELEIVVVVVVGVENWDCRVEEIEENERMRLNPDRGRDFVEVEGVVVEEYILEVVVAELLWKLNKKEEEEKKEEYMVIISFRLE